MYINKNFSPRQIWDFSKIHVIWILLWTSLVAFLYYNFAAYWINIPWKPVGVIGTAVAFYVGFKNNQSYGRLWEARKIWGAIVNSSRAWGSAVKGFVHATQNDGNTPNSQEVALVKKRLIYRHIAWLYTLRKQLLKPAPWEHINQTELVKSATKKRMRKYGKLRFQEQMSDSILDGILTPSEIALLSQKQNGATFLIDEQTTQIQQLHELGQLDTFKHVELQKILYDFYIHQGKCERIKNFPFPRQYASMSLIFVIIFIFLMPLSLIPEFAKLSEIGFWLFIPIASLVAWVFLMMELVGDYSENPFEGLGNDVPMLALCRTIENDLREMLNETDLPAPIESKDGVLM